MSDGKGKVQLTLDEGSNAVIERGGMTVQFNASGLVVNVQGAMITVDKSGTVAMQAAANDASETKATLEIGDIERDGDHKGEIYGGILPSDNKPIWFLAAPKSMDHFNAASWATEQGGALPTKAQGDYLTTLKDKGGALTELFTRGTSFPAGYVWLAEPSTHYNNYAWCQRLSDGDQNDYGVGRVSELPVLSVRR